MATQNSNINCNIIESVGMSQAAARQLLSPENVVQAQVCVCVCVCVCVAERVALQLACIAVLRLQFSSVCSVQCRHCCAL
jgi:hypothetical protein